MATELSSELMTAIRPRVVDLRSEYEAQLRAVARLEAQLARGVAGRDPANHELADVLRRELTEMLTNNKNIRDVLVELAVATGAPTAG